MTHHPQHCEHECKREQEITLALVKNIPVCKECFDLCVCDGDCQYDSYIEQITKQSAHKATLKAYEKFMSAIDYRFNDTHRGRGVISTIKEIKETLCKEENP